MAFLVKGRKQDLMVVCEELGEAVPPSSLVPEIKQIILKSKFYDEEEVKILLERIIDDRLKREKEEKEEKMKREKDEKEEKLRQEEREERIRKEEKEREDKIRKEENDRQERLDEMQHELELKRLEMTQRDSLPQTNRDLVRSSPKIQLTQITPKFDEKQDEMGLYLINFERKAEMAQVPKDDWTAYLLGVLPAEISNLLAREPPENANNYEFVKSLILKRYKLNSEKLKQCFYRQRKTPEKSWRNYAHELSCYFTEWIEDLEISTFQQLKDLLITEQIKFRIPDDIREHFLDRWIKMKTPYELAETIDEYESIRESFRKKEFPQKTNKLQPNDNKGYKFKEPAEEVKKTQWGRKDPQAENNNEEEFERRTQRRCYECGSPSHLRPQCDKLKKVEYVASNITSRDEEGLAPYISRGKVNGVEMPILRDTGSTVDLICQKYVKPSMYTNEKVWIKTPLEEDMKCLPLAEVELQCDLGYIVTKAAVLRNSLDKGMYLLGNKTAAKLKEVKQNESSKIYQGNAVQDRAQKKISDEKSQGPEVQQMVPEDVSDHEIPENLTEEEKISPMADPLQSELGLKSSSPREHIEERKTYPQETRSDSISKSRCIPKNRELYFRKEAKKKRKNGHPKKVVKRQFVIGDEVLARETSKPNKSSVHCVGPGTDRHELSRKVS